MTRRLIVLMFALFHAFNGQSQPTRYVSDLDKFLSAPLKKCHLKPYYDYDEAYAASAKYKKPVLVYFSGINCMNCRKMEEKVLSDVNVARRLNTAFIVAVLYCDAGIISTYPETNSGKQVAALGKRNIAYQLATFKSNSQPIMYIVDDKAKKIVPDEYQYDTDVNKFKAELDKAELAYRKTHH